MFAFTAARGPVGVAFTDRLGGVSATPYDELNLGLPTQPPPGLADPDRYREERAANLDRVREALGGVGVGSGPSTLVLMHQVHGADVAVVAADRPTDSPEPVADVLVTDLPGVALVVRAADCVPVLLADPERGVVGAAHAGRGGLAAGVVPAAVRALREHGAGELVAWVGPHVCGRCYEVPEELRAEVAALVPDSWAETSWGTPSLALGAGVTAQLRAEGGIEVVDASACTLERLDLYSHRRDGPRSGRLAGLVWVAA